MKRSKTAIDIRMTGERLKEYARVYEYTVKDIQHYLELSCPQAVYRWFRGIILPSVDNLLKLSELFEVHMEELLVKEGEGREAKYIFENMNRFALQMRMSAYRSKVKILVDFGLSVQ